MAKVYDETYSDSSGTERIRQRMLTYDYWDHVEYGQTISISGTAYKFTKFYLDAAETVCIAVGEPYELPRSYSIIFQINNEFDTDDILNPNYQNGRLFMVENNTGMFACTMPAESDGKIPNGFFVAQALSQDGQNNVQNVAGRFFGNGSNVDVNTKTYEFIGYILYVTGETFGEGVKIQKNFNASYGQGYNCLLPLIGADAGIPSGIFYPLQLETDYKDVLTLRMNGKTFYLCGNAAIIDYFDQ
ncbi:hypothetical protein [Ruminococcus sp.]|uniref:hypothetical protein n=1 Tax=Ruminococcus sp. TaxID=41978 RepID=UPI001B747FB4|nr:hypothetical protein [Ruminococcus sp.]MBP5433665.1 hypothetical protein [Ruminococcus sp.]